MTQPGPHPILGRKFMEALAEAGILRVEDRIRRVIIDASMDGAVLMYVERYGDDRLLSVAAGGVMKNGGYVIRYVPHEPVEQT